MDLILKNAQLDNRERCDIGIAAARSPRSRRGSKPRARRSISAAGSSQPASSRPTSISTSPASSIAVKSEHGDLDEAIGEAAKAKAAFTPEDVHARASRTLEKSILHGTTHMRTHLEVDPGVGLRSLEGVLPLIKEYAWAIDLQICVFPQEGLLNNPGTDELMVEALERGCRAVGGAPYTDSDPPGQIDRVFELAREYDIDIDMHLDFGPTCRRHGSLARLPAHRGTSIRRTGHHRPRHQGDQSAARRTSNGWRQRLADAGVALTVLPSTDLYLMGRHHIHDHNSPAAWCRRTSCCTTASTARCRATTCSIRSRRSAIARRCAWRISTPISVRLEARPTCANASTWSRSARLD